MLMRRTQSDSSELSREFMRPLSARRQHKVAQKRHWFNAPIYPPQNALVSSTTRTNKTYDLFQVENCRTLFKTRLFCHTTTLLDTLKKACRSSFLMIKHKFGISDLANCLPKG